MFDNNFDKCEPIFKILSPLDSQENSPRLDDTDFHLTCSISSNTEGYTFWDMV